MVLAGALSLGLPSYAVAGAAVGADCAWGRLSVMEACGRISSSTLPPRRAVRTWKSGLCLRPRILQSFWCMGVACGVRRIGFFGTRALLGSTVDTCFTGGFGRILAFSTLR